MAWSPSAIFEVVSVYGHRVAELRIADDVMQNANAGRTNYQQKICIAFRRHIQKRDNRDPGYVPWESLRIKHLRDVPAPSPRAKVGSKP